MFILDCHSADEETESGTERSDRDLVDVVLFESFVSRGVNTIL